MTMIVTVLSPTLVFQVSDRRSSWRWPDGSITTRDNTSNKVVIYDDRVVFGVAGMGELEGQRADLWVANRVAQPSLEDGYVNLREDLSALFCRRQYRGQMHTVASAGWKIEPDGSLAPFYSLVTNHMRNGIWLPTAESRFSWIVEVLKPQQSAIHQVPNWLPSPEFTSLRRNLQSAEYRSLHVSYGVRLLIDAVRGQSRRHPEIGGDLLEVVLPQSAVNRVPGEVLVRSGPAHADLPTFAFWPEDVAERVQYGPTTASTGGGVMTDFESRPLP